MRNGKANQFKIIYDGNGATGGEVIEQVISYGREAWMNQNGFERPGYRFVEWNRMPDGTGEAYADKSECSTLTTDNDVIILLFAQWEKVPYTITYYLNGGTNSSKNPTKYDVESEEIVLENPTRTGYSFKGWYSDEACTEEITGIAAGSIGDRCFYAKWEKDAETPTDKPDGAPDNQPGGNTDGTADKTPGGTADEKTYEIRYKLNGGTNHRGNPRTYQSTSAVTLQKPTRKGYTFAGWYTDEKFKSKVTQIKKGNTGTKTLYAKWTPNQYRILYQTNGGKGKKITPQTKLKYGSSYLLKKNSLKRDGYKFAGWNTKKNGKGKTYKDKAKVKNLVEKANGSITLYAQWKPITYKITYKLNGGKNSRHNPKKYDVTTNVKLKEPTRKGYKFKGWYTSASYKKKVTKLKKGSIGNQKLYAKWVKLK